MKIERQACQFDSTNFHFHKCLGSDRVQAAQALDFELTIQVQQICRKALLHSHSLYYKRNRRFCRGTGLNLCGKYQMLILVCKHGRPGADAVG